MSNIQQITNRMLYKVKSCCVVLLLSLIASQVMAANCNTYYNYSTCDNLVGCTVETSGPGWYSLLPVSGASYRLNTVIRFGRNSTNNYTCTSSNPSKCLNSPGTIGEAWVATGVCVLDSDSDGVSDASDNCPVNSNTGQLDSDLDAVGDACDIDDDNDTVVDVDDACALGMTGTGNDFDADGCKNTEDADDDNDGVADAFDACSLGVVGPGSDWDGDGCKDSEDDGAVSSCNANIPLGKPDNIYALHNNGTVTDLETGLMWQQCSLGLSGAGCATGTAGRYTWKEALEKAQTANISASEDGLGYTDWRLPSVAELRTLTDKACYGRAINATFFPAALSSGYWSSSPFASNNLSAWLVNFYNGSELAYDKNGAFYVRLVRGGR